MPFDVVIPARWESTRLPGKVLADLHGMPMIQRVYERAVLSDAEVVVIATDSHEILQVVEEFGGEAILTDPEPISPRPEPTDIMPATLFCDAPAWRDRDPATDIEFPGNICNATVISFLLFPPSNIMLPLSLLFASPVDANILPELIDPWDVSINTLPLKCKVPLPLLDATTPPVVGTLEPLIRFMFPGYTSA